MIQEFIREFSRLPQVTAIALGGSRAGTHFDSASDYDIYIYCSEPIPEETRRKYLGPLSRYVEYGNHFWELEDNGTFLNGIDFDILYRNLDDFTAGVASVVEGHHCQNAYTTCMWHNLITCKVLYDPSGALEAAKRRFLVPYPKQLRENILYNGWRLLRTSMPAYETQIIKAAKRGDLVSVNHRISAFLETYFDVLFAANRQTHPGEKRLIPLCRELCPLLPDNFEENLNALFSHIYNAPECIPGDLSAILLELEKII